MNNTRDWEITPKGTLILKDSDGWLKVEINLSREQSRQIVKALEQQIIDCKERAKRLFNSIGEKFP